MTKGQHDLWKKTRKEIVGSSVTYPQLLVIAKLHSELWQHKYYRPCSSCASTWAKWVDDLDLLQKTYKDVLPE